MTSQLFPQLSSVWSSKPMFSWLSSDTNSSANGNSPVNKQNDGDKGNQKDIKDITQQQPSLSLFDNIMVSNGNSAKQQENKPPGFESLEHKHLQYMNNVEKLFEGENRDIINVDPLNLNSLPNTVNVNETNASPSVADLECNQLVNQFEDGQLTLTPELALSYSCDPIHNKVLLKYLLSHYNHRKEFDSACLRYLSIDSELFNLLYDYKVSTGTENPMNDFKLLNISFYNYNSLLNIVRKGYKFKYETFFEAVNINYCSILWQIVVNLDPTEVTKTQSYIDSLLQCQALCDVNIWSVLYNIRENYTQE